MDRYSTLGAQIVVSKGNTSRLPPRLLYNVLLVPAFTFL